MSELDTVKRKRSGRAPFGVPYVSWHQLHRDILTFAHKLPKDLVGIVGIPRSGMMVAVKLALRLQLHVADIDSFCQHGFWRTGRRLEKCDVPRGGKVLLLDDSVHSKASMEAASARFAGGGWLRPFECGPWEIVPAALYMNPRAEDHDILYHRKIRTPRLFAWNWYYNVAMTRCLFDFDGVLCPDPVTPEDDEEAYLEEIANLPLLFPLKEIGGIITHRLESRRELCLDWLKRNGVKAKFLIMRPEKTPQERRKNGQDGTWKGKEAKKSPHRFFIESNPKQSQKIASITHLQVLCTDNDTMYPVGNNNALLGNRTG